MYERGSPPLTPNVQSLTLTTGNTEYSLNLSPGCRAFTVQCRTAADVRMAFVTGKVASPTDPYYTIKSGTVYTSPPNFATKLGTTSGQTGQATQTIYFANSAGSVVVELTEWTA